MKALLRPLFVGGLSIAIAGTTLLGSSSVALAATRPTFTSLSVTTPVNEGDKPTVTGTFTDPDLTDQHTVQIFWGDGSSDFYTLTVGARSFVLQKSVGYPDDGGAANPLLIQVTLSDPAFSVSKFLNITVLNVPPSFVSFALSTTDTTAGQTVTATGLFTDPGIADTHTVSVNWGDGSAPWTASLLTQVYAFTTVPHAYPSAGTFTVTATVTDKDLASTTATSSVTVHAANQPPSVVSFVVTAGSEGSASSLALIFSDPDPADTHNVTVAWGDGSTTGPVLLASTITSYNTTHVYLNTGTYPVLLTLADSAGHSVTAGASVSPANVPPTVGGLGFSPASVVDHQLVTVSGSFTDPGTADTFTVTVDWGDLTSSTVSLLAGERTFLASHAYIAPGTFTVKVSVADRDNGTGTSSADLVVLPSNHAPANLVLTPGAWVEGGSATLGVSFTDADAADTHTVTLDWGDGSSEKVSLLAGVTSTSPMHTYVATGTYTITVTVTDNGGLSVGGSTTVAVTNVAPTVAALALSPVPVTDHQTLTVTGSFTDPGTADTFTLTVDWGDLSAVTTQALAAGTRTFTAAHDYQSAATYLVTVTVTDRDGGTGTQTAAVVVTAPPASAADLLDQMSALVKSFNLDRNTERWLLKKVDELRESLAEGDDEFCDDLRDVTHLDFFADRTLTDAQAAAFKDLSSQLASAAGCAPLSPNTRRHAQTTNAPAKPKPTWSERRDGDDTRSGGHRSR